MQPERHLRDHAQRAERSGHQLGQVVARDVLHHLAAALGNRAIGQHHRHADDQVAQAAIPQPQRAAIIRRENSAHRRLLRPQRIERDVLAMLRRARAASSPRCAGLDRHRQVRPAMLEHALQPRCSQHQVREHRIAPAALRPCAAISIANSCPTTGAHHGRYLLSSRRQRDCKPFFAAGALHARKGRNQRLDIDYADGHLEILRHAGLSPADEAYTARSSRRTAWAAETPCPGSQCSPDRTRSARAASSPGPARRTCCPSLAASLRPRRARP